MDCALVWLPLSGTSVWSPTFPLKPAPLRTLPRLSRSLFLDQDLYEKPSLGLLQWSEPKPGGSEKPLPPVPRVLQPDLCTDRPVSTCFSLGPEETSSSEFSMARRGNPACQEKGLEEGGGEKRPSSGGSSGQCIKEAGFCWKLCAPAKTRWKDQSGLYELAPSCALGLTFFICTTGLGHHAKHRIWILARAQGNNMVS